MKKLLLLTVLTVFCVNVHTMHELQNKKCSVDYDNIPLRYYKKMVLLQVQESNKIPMTPFEQDALKMFTMMINLDLKQKIKFNQAVNTLTEKLNQETTQEQLKLSNARTRNVLGGSALSAASLGLVAKYLNPDDFLKYLGAISAVGLGAGAWYATRPIETGSILNLPSAIEHNKGYAK